VFNLRKSPKAGDVSIDTLCQPITTAQQVYGSTRGAKRQLADRRQAHAVAKSDGLPISPQILFGPDYVATKQAVGSSIRGGRQPDDITDPEVPLIIHERVGWRPIHSEWALCVRSHVMRFSGVR